MKRLSFLLVIAGLSGLPGVVHAAGVSPATATAAELERAQMLFLQGKADHEAGKHQAAFEAFRASYETVASPNSHLFMARCLSALGQVADAYREYGLVSEEAKHAALQDQKYAATQAAADAEQAELREKVGFLVVRLTNAPLDATVTVAGESLSQEALALPIAVNPGLIEVSAASSSSPARQSIVMIAQGEQKEVLLDLAGAAGVTLAADDVLATDAGVDEDERVRKRLRTAAFVAGGVGAAGLITFAVAGSMASSTYATLRDECGGPCPSRQADIDAGRRSQTIANVGLAVGAVGLGAGTVLYLVSRPKAQVEAVGSSPPSPLMTAEVAAGPSWLGVRGTFR